jgi:ATP-dependent DNA helicase PIF1
VRVAEQFCYEFCVAVGVMWCYRTFLFTAYTGSAASLIGGVTILKAAYINQNKQLSADNINEWKDVRILVIDEVSFMSDRILRTLNYKLMNIGNRSKSFGGFSIIFVGDFRQLESICSKESDLMFSSLSSNLWKNNTNAIIILDNKHCFKEDPDYGQCLKECGMVI